MLTKEFVKNYLRVDGEEEDELIEFLIEESKEEIKVSTGDDGTTPSHLYKMAQLLIVVDRYENRGAEKEELKPNNALNAILLKLRCKASNDTSK